VNEKRRGFSTVSYEAKITCTWCEPKILSSLTCERCEHFRIMEDLLGQARQQFMENGVCILRGVIPKGEVDQFRASLEDVFRR
jgi:hypothetical protein